MTDDRTLEQITASIHAKLDRMPTMDDVVWMVVTVLGVCDAVLVGLVVWLLI